MRHAGRPEALPTEGCEVDRPDGVARGEDRKSVAELRVTAEADRLEHSQVASPGAAVEEEVAFLREPSKQFDQGKVLRDEPAQEHGVGGGRV
jgi:hypothetical protein